VRDGAHALAPPPRGLGVRGDPDGAGDVGCVTVARLHTVVIEAGGKEEDGLAARSFHDVAHVRGHQGAPREHAEVHGLQMGEEAVVALDGEHGLPGSEPVTVAQGPHGELGPSGHPLAGLTLTLEVT